MFISTVTAALCCLAIVTMAVAQRVVAADNPQFARLPGSSIVAQVPQGWECSVSGTAAVGNEQTHVMECVPHEGGVPLTLQRKIGGDKPTSLEAFLQRSKTAYDQALPGDFYAAPSRTEMAGRPAVEVVSVGEATVFAAAPVGPAGPFKRVNDSIVFEDRGAFYACDLQTALQQYNEDLRQIHRAFCDSLKFDAN
jgi:hypothetical protein